MPGAADAIGSRVLVATDLALCRQVDDGGYPFLRQVMVRNLDAANNFYVVGRMKGGCKKNRFCKIFKKEIKMKAIKLFGFLMMGMAFSIPSYAGSGIADCSTQSGKANAAHAVAKRCATKVNVMRRSGVPDDVIEDRTGNCRGEERALTTANRAYARCRQIGLGMTPRRYMAQ